MQTSSRLGLEAELKQPGLMLENEEVAKVTHSASENSSILKPENLCGGPKPQNLCCGPFLPFAMTMSFSNNKNSTRSSRY